MLTSYVALVRGVAPSTPPRDNASILGVLSGLGFTDLQAVLSSGNYVFRTDETSTDALETRIEKAFETELKVSLMTIVMTRAQIERLIAGNPLAGVPHGRENYQLVTFFKDDVDLGVELPYEPPGKAFRLVERVDGALFSVNDNTKQQTTGLMTWLERNYTTRLTSRTPMTLAKILGRLNEMQVGSARELPNHR